MTTVLLTGASGFLGAHTVQHLLDAGHRVRALVRTPSRLDAALRPLGLGPDDDRIEVARGDMTDDGAVRAAVDGCGAVVHAAATYSFKRRDTETMRRDNAAGTRIVLEAGRDAGCRVLVHVSSTVALTRPGGMVLNGAFEGAKIAACGCSIDGSAATRDLGVSARPLRESLADTVRWLVDLGHLSRRLAGEAVG